MDFDLINSQSVSHNQVSRAILRDAAAMMGMMMMMLLLWPVVVCAGNEWDIFRSMEAAAGEASLGFCMFIYVFNVKVFTAAEGCQIKS